LGFSGVNVGKGLKGYRSQDIVPDDTDCKVEPGQEVVIEYDDYVAYINGIARRFFNKLPSNSRWDIDEFRSEAWLALYECAARYYNSEYNDNLKAFAYPYIVKRLSEFMANNMYSLKARYYNVKKNEENFAKINWLERTLWTESQCGDPVDDEDNPILSKPSGITSMMDEAGSKEETDIIKGIVNEDLPTRERRAIVRRFRDGETYRAIGARLGVSAETARKLVIRGLERIKEKAENAGVTSN
jgi:RNA polymerase sigma factor (sigma-70 family)